MKHGISKLVCVGVVSRKSDKWSGVAIGRRRHGRRLCRILNPSGPTGSSPKTETENEAPSHAYAKSGLNEHDGRRKGSLATNRCGAPQPRNRRRRGTQEGKQSSQETWNAYSQSQTAAAALADAPHPRGAERFPAPTDASKTAIGTAKPLEGATLQGGTWALSPSRPRLPRSGGA